MYLFVGMLYFDIFFFGVIKKCFIVRKVEDFVLNIVLILESKLLFILYEGE